MRGNRARLGGAALCGLVALVALAALASTAQAASLYTGPGSKPGPSLLYEPAPPTPPQLQNSGVWNAEPILVSGASAYRAGEFLYQDFLYDDHGAHVADDPGDPRAGGNTFSRPNGTYTYPTDAVYAQNAADLVELRVRPLPDATAFRVTLNTMKDASRVAFSIAIGGTPGVPFEFPRGANVRAPAEMFLTVHPGGDGMVGELVHAGTGAPVDGGSPSVSLDAVRRQIEVRVPHSAWDPGGSTVRLAAGVGLWDGATGNYLVPRGAADSSHPGGGSARGAAFFNVAFRNDEPMPAVTDAGGTAQNPAWWRDRAQAQALAAGDITEFSADVDFGKLAARVDDDSGVPKNGPIDRILASRFDNGQGTDWGDACLTKSQGCLGEIRGRLQPYAIYVPRRPEPSQGWGLTLLLHSLAANYNQYLASRNESQFGERGPGSIVMTTESRGPDGSYTSYPGAEVFEVWADIARRYRLDPDYTVITGYSMGGLGTFKLAEQFPDLFARAQPTVGASSDNQMVASLRNIPVLMWNGGADELVNPALYVPTAQELDRLAYRYELDVFVPGEHISIAYNDQFAPAAEFLGTAKVDRNPAHVTFVANPAQDYPTLGFVADHAYWASSVRLRRASDGHGTVDALSHGFGQGDPPASDTGRGTGVLTGGTLPAYPYTRQFKTWKEPAPRIRAADRLDLTARNVSSLAIDTGRARLGCSPTLNVDSDGPIAIRLAGCGRTVRLGCLNSRGGASGTRLGPARLGRTRTRQRHLFRGKALRSRRGIDRYCVTGGGSYRIGYPTTRLSRAQRKLARRRAVMILTSSRRFRVRGIRRGTSVRLLRRRLGGERRLRIGHNTWYLARGRKATLLYKARGRRVLEVGIADRRLTRSRASARRLLRSWELRRRPR